VPELPEAAIEAHVRALDARYEIGLTGDWEAAEIGLQAAAPYLRKQAQEEERERLKEVLLSELEGAGWSSGEEMPTDEVIDALDRVCERAALDSEERDA
jgi:hypothetical protein